MNAVDFEHGGESYQALPHTGFDAFDLARKVQQFCTSLYSSDKLAATDSPEYVTSFFAAFSDAIAALPSLEYRWLVESTLSRVTVTTEGKKNERLSNFDSIAAHFAGRYNDLYAVMFQVWQIEKFPPFVGAPEAGA